MNQKTIFVGLSGGVDSAVSAALLQRQGHRVVGVFLESWSTDFAPSHCDQARDRRDAARVAVALRIPFLVLPCAEQYRQRVFSQFLSEIQAGRTPNPDALCNSEIKFSLFQEIAIAAGADAIATGHYARLTSGPTPMVRRGADPDKDQSYFLARVPTAALAKVVFPIGQLRKVEVRALARRWNIPVADKPDSQGLCFVGKIRLPDFLQAVLAAKPGVIQLSNGVPIGHHANLHAFTIGQRHGLRLGTGEPLFVKEKNAATGTVTVTPIRQELNQKKIALASVLRHDVSDFLTNTQVQVRYRQSPTPVRRSQWSDDQVRLELKDPVEVAAPGQVAALYRADHLVASGIIV